MFLSKPGWADLNSANLTPASGCQDHTTSPYAATSFVSSPFDRSRAFRQPALPSRCAPDAAASTASHPASLTIRIRPSVGRDGESSRSDLGCVGTEIFFGKPEIRLDTPVNKLPDGQITARRREQIPLVSRTRCSALRAAPQSRDPQQIERHDGPRISSAPRRKCGALRSIRGTSGARK